MHVISRKPFMDAMQRYPNDAAAIDATYRVLDKGNFSTPQELKAVFKSLDNFRYQDKLWVIDIGGNNLRLLAFIKFEHKRIFVKHIVDHKEYDALCKKYRR